MTIRPLQPDDIPTLKAMYVTQGFAYEFPNLVGSLMEAVMVVEDENGKILAAVAAERLVQLYFFCGGDQEHPATRLAIIRSLHVAMADVLRKKGYHSAEACIPPSVEKSFANRLKRTFGWEKNPWNTWVKGF